MEDKYILAIESSCDETSAAVVVNGREVLSNVIASQIDTHKKYGGVVPEVASRMHIEAINGVVEEALEEANITLDKIDAIGVTYGPGLVGALLVGLQFAKGLAFATKKPLIGVNHIEGHICANYIQHKELKPPFVSLVVSGGHTFIVHVKNYGEYEVIGQTRDDAAGEAYDKVARALGLGYPGGPKIDKLAKEGNPKAIAFPKANFHEETLDFSFSGVKSAVLNYLNKCKMQNIEVNNADVAASFQYAVIDVLKENVLLTCKKKNVKTIAIAGGVASNSSLRETLIKEASKRGIEVLFPAPILCTDNAAMIGSAAYFNFINEKISDLNLNAKPNLKLNN
ncbi:MULTISPECIES: tRNA (adenosine(37)-N6)-threonylcarbamoyltransferase complex transferase subunit TsaD [unclassified Clostridium]|jgi:N6-L-threonylcarbamoyladenine synthase|uniref:tRNA (adenosine(37)-N6)-threonylcarbamoyltransferase complex transferase subunit TsaD n=1 Tax=Clostridium TaxID=1485 RepID=UPI001C8B7BF4|nr:MULTISPECIES: tRNA (adenosine(37)-N6)-threonylcarbamoyltransferase complex transferase subunit TsaD [unclassified Clostridium]MBX9138196.1 tRNA (adenosine(37)-N6)-threonylcarbamoyltransferase complex transferase subunit TsaD [Clostridium sp. K12(2020)]MBX9142884.1 tRNA (adenosine(37)-N6)-threonylcarbamoyltransferase complex transferase subunit TsaD [Clostridium sp. K13]MDU2291882.1 tRNA (adenosine(37)-N6)-threonylcarbamoyltransferase complex transferase subunit TsaD [Clostridium celatum]MDU4